MKGRLEDMAVADLIQHNCQDRKTARIQLRNGRQKGELFFKNGNVVHATLDDQVGEHAVYRMVNWVQGTFELTPEVDPPSISITRNWTSLLLEAARLVDEGQITTTSETGPTKGEAILGRYDRFIDIVQDFGNVGTPQQLVERISKKIEGHRFTCLTQFRGDSVFWFSPDEGADREELLQQINQFVQLVDTTDTQVNSGSPHEMVLNTETAYLLARFLGYDNYCLLIAADKNKAQASTLRQIADSYMEHLLLSLRLEAAQ